MKNIKKAIIAGAVIGNSLGIGSFLSAQAKTQTKKTSKALIETLDTKRTTNTDSLIHIAYIHEELDSLPTDTIEQEAIKEVNIVRESYGVGPLKINEKLCKAAALHAQDMYEKNYFSHTNKVGKHSRDRVSAQNYKAQLLGENLAKTHTISNAIDNQWIQSKGHKETMLLPTVLDVGIGYYKGYIVMLVAKPF